MSSKEFNWLDKMSTHHSEKTELVHFIDGEKHIVNSDSIFDTDVDSERGIRKEKQKIQKITSFLSFTKNHTKGKRSQLKSIIRNKKRANERS